MKLGFDNEKYLTMQAEHIRQRRAQFVAAREALHVVSAVLESVALHLPYVLVVFDNIDHVHILPRESGATDAALLKHHHKLFHHIFYRILVNPRRVNCKVRVNYVGTRFFSRST